MTSKFSCKEVLIDNLNNVKVNLEAFFDNIEKYNTLNVWCKNTTC